MRLARTHIRLIWALMSKVVEDLVSGHNWVICPWRGLSPRGQPGCFILAVIASLGSRYGVHNPEQAERVAAWVIAAGELVEQSVHAIG